MVGILDDMYTIHGTSTFADDLSVSFEQSLDRTAYSEMYTSHMVLAHLRLIPRGSLGSISMEQHAPS